jgi:copper chaperone CopZ
MEGVRSVKTNYAKQETEIEFDEAKVKMEDVLGVVKKLGYEATAKQV